MLSALGSEQRVCDECGAAKQPIESGALSSAEFGPLSADYRCPNGHDDPGKRRVENFRCSSCDAELIATEARLGMISGKTESTPNLVCPNRCADTGH